MSAIETEKQIHKSMISFLVFADNIKFLKNSVMSHKEWFDKINTVGYEFEKVVRGYAMDNKIVYYKGEDMHYDNEVLQVALDTHNDISLELGFNNPEIWCGVKKGEIGVLWEPIFRLDELQNAGVGRLNMDKRFN